MPLPPDKVWLPKYSIGVGDRFAHQATAQLQACKKASEQGVTVIPVWNKSNREHTIIGSTPSEVRAAAKEAVQSLGWRHPYFVDADHINLATVDRFLEPCDFFTIDVADWIGKPSEQAQIDRFLERRPELLGVHHIPGIDQPLEMTRERITNALRNYLAATQEAGQIYRYIEQKKGGPSFIPEVSMDETDSPQTPADLLIILAALADEKIPLETIAPKFSGRFNKAVDYQGDLEQFTREFSDDVAVLAYAAEKFMLPENLKLSVHSGSDKFSIYRPIHEILKKFDAGLHLKTAGTTWLEELTGLAECGGEALDLVKEVYAEAFSRREELSKPYASVIDIKAAELPSPSEVCSWSSARFAAALRHDRNSSSYNPSLRQLLHIGFKVAAHMGSRYLDLVSAAETFIAKNVTENLFARHIKPVFIGT